MCALVRRLLGFCPEPRGLFPARSGGSAAQAGAAVQVRRAGQPPRHAHVSRAGLWPSWAKAERAESPAATASLAVSDDPTRQPDVGKREAARRRWPSRRHCSARTGAWASGWQPEPTGRRCCWPRRRGRFTAVSPAGEAGPLGGERGRTRPGLGGRRPALTPAAGKVTGRDHGTGPRQRRRPASASAESSTCWIPGRRHRHLGGDALNRTEAGGVRKGDLDGTPRPPRASAWLSGYGLSHVVDDDDGHDGADREEILWPSAAGGGRGWGHRELLQVGGAAGPVRECAPWLHARRRGGRRRAANAPCRRSWPSTAATAYGSSHSSGSTNASSVPASASSRTRSSCP